MRFHSTSFVIRWAWGEQKEKKREARNCFHAAVMLLMVAISKNNFTMLSGNLLVPWKFFLGLTPSKTFHFEPFSSPALKGPFSPQGDASSTIGSLGPQQVRCLPSMQPTWVHSSPSHPLAPPEVTPENRDMSNF